MPEEPVAKLKLKEIKMELRELGVLFLESVDRTYLEQLLDAVRMRERYKETHMCFGVEYDKDAKGKDITNPYPCRLCAEGRSCAFLTTHTKPQRDNAVQNVEEKGEPAVTKKKVVEKKVEEGTKKVGRVETVAELLVTSSGKNTRKEAISAIAEALGVKVPTAQQRYYAAVKKLKEDGYTVATDDDKKVTVSK